MDPKRRRMQTQCANARYKVGNWIYENVSQFGSNTEPVTPKKAGSIYSYCALHALVLQQSKDYCYCALPAFFF
jgi:hypothetical protein